ncbi:hypothetical protein [Dyella sp. 2HG41-7]|uniref:hypothetical protein n=1 Tax=Dyella sp. 2HG41-7 TaxID=2883239 RepID=UPI001F16BEC1|nr:hypothetical protein [Dyella sp. 2HG41-7]
MQGTYTKLKDGSWGVWINQAATDIQPGDVVFVLPKNGGVKHEIVRHVLWSGEDRTLCAIETGNRKRLMTVLRNGCSYGHI